MGVTVDVRHNAGTFASVTAASWNHSITAGLTNPVLVVPVHTTMGSSAQTPSTVKWDTAGTPVSLTKLGSATTGASTASLWLRANPVSGTKQITVAWAATADEVTAGSASYQNVNQSTPWNAASPQSTSGVAPIGGVVSLTVTSATNEMAIACIVEEGGNGISPSGSQTKIYASATSSAAAEAEDLAGAASVSMGFQGLFAADNYCILGGSLQFGAGAAPTPGVGQLTLTGYAPTVFNGLVPSLGQVVLTGYAPTISAGSVAVMPGVGQVVLTGYPPTIIVPTLRAVSFIAYQQSSAPTLTLDVSPSLAEQSTTPPASPQPGSAPARPVVSTPSLRMQLPNAPKTYDPVDQAQLRLAIMEAAQRFSEQSASGALTVKIVQLDPSPLSEAGFNLRFQVHAIDAKGLTPQVEIIGLQGAGVAIVSGPAFGVLSPNGTIWKVSLASPSLGPGGTGTVIVRAQTPDGRSMDVSIPIPEQTVIAQPGAVISFDPIPGNTAKQANVSFTVSCPKGTTSMKWLGSKVSQPTVAAVVAGGTTVSPPSDGNNFAQNNIDTVTLGDTYYVTVVPFTGTSGGDQLPAIKLKATFSVWGKQKTAFYQRTSWICADPAFGFTTNSTSDIVNAALSSAVIRDQFRINTVIPIGALLVSASMTCFWNTATNPLGLFQFGIDANGININFGSAVQGSNPQTVTVGLSNTAVTSGFVVLRNTWAPPVLANADAGQGGLQDVNITYIAPTQDVTP